MTTRYFAVLLAVTLTMVFTGCKDKDDKAGERSPITDEKSGKEKAPNAAGHWVGTWESTKNKGHGGGLSCDAVEKGKNEWEAVFTAEYGKTSKYNVNLKGKPEGGKVVFGGKVDLGKDGGGIFTWTGRATDTEFTGEYEGGGDTGTFKMTRGKKSGRIRTNDDTYLSDKATRPFVE